MVLSATRRRRVGHFFSKRKVREISDQTTVIVPGKLADSFAVSAIVSGANSGCGGGYALRFLRMDDRAGRVLSAFDDLCQ